MLLCPPVQVWFLVPCCRLTVCVCELHASVHSKLSEGFASLHVLFQRNSLSVSPCPQSHVQGDSNLVYLTIGQFFERFLLKGELGLGSSWLEIINELINAGQRNAD